ncbi:murein transglycosylase A [Pararhodospirillum oryzae]|uniref:murein transglycosylase A n=1 Tax=Pararhodospirillum oryzae TaxID=478448 RepID=UPI001FE59C6B|nr:MltA domain-containing protein [Pararhodospirillum oryzae]
MIPRATRALGRLTAAGMLAVMAACAQGPQPREGGDGQVHYRPVPIESLPGWDTDTVAEALPALTRSCARLATLPGSTPVGPRALGVRAADWAPPCAEITRVAALGTGTTGLRQTLAQAFQAWQVIGPDGPNGLFTGYYETTLDASPTRLPGYTTPLYALPPGWETPAPRPDRAAIEDGALNGVATVLLWARDPIDAFFLHIQGSGVARLPDGRRVRIGYAGNNGHPFVGIGGLMRQRGLGDGSSMPAIRAWLRTHPEEGRALMRDNPRYIFFRFVNEDGPIGAQGVPLTAGRSLAVDRDHIPLGAPVWLDTTDAHGGRVSRLLVAQDTGSAIRGAVRGDLFWGTGEEALYHAGGMKSPGRLWILLPRAAVVARACPSAAPAPCQAQTRSSS